MFQLCWARLSQIWVVLICLALWFSFSQLWQAAGQRSGHTYIYISAANMTSPIHAPVLEARWRIYIYIYPTWKISEEQQGMGQRINQPEDLWGSMRSLNRWYYNSIYKCIACPVLKKDQRLNGQRLWRAPVHDHYFILQIIINTSQVIGDHYFVPTFLSFSENSEFLGTTTNHNLAGLTIKLYIYIYNI